MSESTRMGPRTEKRKTLDTGRMLITCYRRVVFFISSVGHVLGGGLSWRTALCTREANIRETSERSQIDTERDKSIYAELSAYKCPSDYLGNVGENVESTDVSAVVRPPSEARGGDCVVHRSPIEV